MKIVVLISDDKEHIVIQNLKKHANIKRMKIIDTIIPDLPSYVEQIKNLDYDVLVILYNSKLNLSKLSVDMFVFDNQNFNAAQHQHFIKYAGAGCYLVVCSDYPPIHFLQTPMIIFDYGLNSKASLTASSNTPENFLCCLQRKAVTLWDAVLEPQEVLIQLEKEQDEMNHILCAISILMLCEKTEKDFSKITF